MTSKTKFDLRSLTKSKNYKDTPTKLMDIEKPVGASPLHFIPPKSDKANKSHIRGRYKPREIKQNEALPRRVSFSGTYDGTELRPYTGREGANDHLKYKSRGIDGDR